MNTPNADYGRSKPHTFMGVTEAEHVMALFARSTNEADQALREQYVRTFGEPKGDDVMSAMKRLRDEAERTLRIHGPAQNDSSEKA